MYQCPATNRPHSQPCQCNCVKCSALQWVTRKDMPFLSAIAWPGDSGVTCVGAVTQSTKPPRKAGGRAAEALAQILYRRPPARGRFGKTLCYHPRSEVVRRPFTLLGVKKERYVAPARHCGFDYRRDRLGIWIIWGVGRVAGAVGKRCSLMKCGTKGWLVPPEGWKRVEAKHLLVRRVSNMS
jgi:hypothetical protein